MGDAIGSALEVALCLVVLAFVPALWWLRRPTARLADRRVRRCLACGYDLRHGTGVCPECGRQYAATGPTAAEVARRLGGN